MRVQKPKYELSEEYAQLALGLDLPEVELEQMPVDQARLISEAGRTALMTLKGAGTQPEWFERYEALVTGGWPWRQACYIAWASMPLDGRMPRTQEDLAKNHLKLSSDRAISTWRKKNPAIDSMVAILQSAELWEHRADSFKSLIEGMKQAGSDYKFFNHLKLYMEMTGDYVPLSQLVASLKKRADGGTHEVDEETLDELEKGATSLEAPFIAPKPVEPDVIEDEGAE